MNKRVQEKPDVPLTTPCVIPIFGLLFAPDLLGWMDGGAKHKTQYSIGNIDGGFCNWTDRVLGHSREERYFAGHNFVAGTAGRA